MKLPKFFSYIPRYIYNNFPQCYFNIYKKEILNWKSNYNQQDLEARVSYYCRLKESREIDLAKATSIKEFKKGKGIHYYFDLKECLHFFPKHFAFLYAFGDDLTVYDQPTIKKARPLTDTTDNSVIFKLNKGRHFQFVQDQNTWEEKQPKLVWRGAAYVENRKQFVQKFYQNSRMNIGQTNRHKEDVPWQLPKLSIQEQLEYQFIACPEGNDVATNLKWVLNSNSLCVMPKPTCETWFMEGELEAGIHFAEVAPDFSNVEEVMDYYINHPQEAKQIIENAHEHVAPFLDSKQETVISYMVLEKYFELTVVK